MGDHGLEIIGLGLRKTRLKARLAGYLVSWEPVLRLVLRYLAGCYSVLIKYLVSERPPAFISLLATTTTLTQDNGSSSVPETSFSCLPSPCKIIPRALVPML